MNIVPGSSGCDPKECETFATRKSKIGLDYLGNVYKSADGGLKVKVQMWDLVNHAKFMSVTKNFYQGAHGVVVVFDSTNDKSFENLGLWDKNIKELAQ